MDAKVNKKILFITSFNKELYNVSGKKLLTTYVSSKSNKHADIFIGTEGAWKLETNWHNALLYNLDTDRFLQEWLQKNKDIIPEYLGGDKPPCKCKNPFSRKEDHVEGCYHSWWNRNCSRWFRKIACLKYCIDFFTTYDYFIWIDCDCTFRKEFTLTDCIGLFKDKSVFYVKGEWRKVEECGIVGYNIKKYGKAFLEKFIELYTNGDFRNCVRWDDSYIFQKARLRNLDEECIDLAKGLKASKVIEPSKLGKWFRHNKGTHGRKLNIMK